ncbi:sensor histidine kinase [Paraurantiacibacter namhicola]|uniref:sensor histidine kinase n=1 Tax=Paraurantiacibacter namhicola TaxID=645517 RepID=UPI001969B0EE|nr:ATP-binding protein [Paraurantiacibacter namhicola]
MALAVIGGVLVLLASQVATERLSRVGDYAQDDNLVLILPGENSQNMANAKRVKPEYTAVPAYVYDDPDRGGPGVFETRFEWSADQPEPALLLAYFRRLDAIELNGNPVAMQNLRNQSLFGSWRPTAVLFERAHLRNGENILRITDPGRSRKVLAPFKIAPADSAEAAAFAGEFFELHLALAVTGIMLFVALFCAFLNWPRAEKLQIRCFILLLALWSVRNAMGFDLFSDLPGPWDVFVAYWIGFLLAAGYAAYCFAWAGKGGRWIAAAWISVALAILLTIVVGHESRGEAFEISYLVESLLIPAFVLIAIAIAARGELQSGAARPVQLLLIVGAGAALAVDALDERFDISLGFIDPQPMIYYATPRHGLLLALGVLGAMIFHQVRARRLSEDLAGELNAQLAVRTAELSDAHEREKLFVRHEALNEERQRIMRDMHDGLGSQLMSMLLAARRGKAEPAKVAEGLQQVVDEMRLMIDSMDSLGENLTAAFSSFRGRLQPRIEDAGFTLVWNDHTAGALPTYRARTTLQIFRIMQEAVVNALKHSNGTTIAVTVQDDPSDPAGLHVTVDDDGPGFAPRRKGVDSGGYGLENMRARARSIGARIDFGQSPSGGGRVALSVPAANSDTMPSRAD